MNSNLKSVYLCSNGVVMAFDTNGQQLPEYQGYYSDVRDIILGDAGPLVEFRVCFWRDMWAIPISRKVFSNPSIPVTLNKISQ